MKRIFPILLAVSLLWGCSAEPQETAPAAAPPTAAISKAAESTEASVPTPVGLYDPESALEAMTGGALQIYPLSRTDGTEILPMGDDLLLFSGENATTLTLLAGSDLYVKAVANLNCLIQADHPAVQASDKGVTYYDEATQELVFLDAQLKEGTRIAMPERIVGSPALSTNRKNLYYCTENTLRTIELDTGLDILLREMAATSHRITALHCSDMIIACRVTDTYGTESDLFISAENGRTLAETSDLLALTTKGSRYFAIHQDSIYPEFLTGTIQETVHQLNYNSFHTTAYPVLDLDGMLLRSDNGQGGTLLEFCNLTSGKRLSLLDSAVPIQPISVAADTGSNTLLMLCYDESYGSHIICRWDLSRSTVADDRNYVVPRYTAQNPDLESLVQCQTLAEELSQRHGVTILLCNDAASENSAALALEPEYQAPILLRWLEELDQLLSVYPRDLLSQLAGGSGNPLRICFVRSFEAADPAEDLSCLLHRDAAADPYLFVTLADSWKTDLNHQLFHVIEAHILTTCPTYDSWTSLNPKGFQYALRYMDEPTDLLRSMLEEGAFVNLYATSFPKEDRAMTMLAALEPGNEAVFESRIMQAKLELLCSGIRTAFGYKKSAEIFRWEQYLK